MPGSSPTNAAGAGHGTAWCRSGSSASARFCNPDSVTASELGKIWEWFADTSCRGYSPLYDRICRAVASDDDVLALVGEAPPDAHLPNVLLGVAHYLLLECLSHPLAAVYAGESDADPAPLFRDLCLGHRDEVLALMQTRRTQTNECGR